jgi:DNA-binding transcriptional ArsR family regulator
MTGYTQKQNELAAKFKALAHPARIKLLQDLLEKECCVGEIQECLSISQPNVSQHLRILKKARVVAGRRDKNRICYSIDDEKIKQAFQLLLKGDKNYEKHS